MAGYWRRAGIGLSCVVAAGVAGAQAYSNHNIRENTATAAALSPYAAEPYERLAIASLRAEGETVYFDTPLARTFAEKAFRRGPLEANAAAILAMSLPDDTDRRDILGDASKLTRRDRILSLAVLQEAAEDRDSPAIMSTLNRLFLASPSVVSRFLPLYVSYLEDDALLPDFQATLATGPVWADRFFQTGNLSQKQLGNMARIRASLPEGVAVSAESDRVLIARLAASGQLPQALTLYEELGGGETFGLDEAISWEDENPPFDWSFVGERGFYARPSGDGETLRVRVAPGKGGPIAARLLRRPENARNLEFTNALGRSRNIENFDIEVACAVTGETLASQQIEPGRTAIALGDEACKWIGVTLTGRVWSTARQVDGTVMAFRFTG